MKYKIKVHSKAESRLVQEHAFKLGAKWADGAKYVKSENGRFLYLRDGRITFDDRESDFKKSLCEQISVDDFIELTTLEDKIENSRGEWLVWVTEVYDDRRVAETEVESCQRFDTEEQARRAHRDIKKVLNAHQVVNALNKRRQGDIESTKLIINAKLGMWCGDDNKDFEEEMKRRGF